MLDEDLYGSYGNLAAAHELRFGLNFHRLMPKLRSTTMNIHPMSSLFLLLAMGTAFGLTGALLATPLAAIIKAYYEEFYIAQFPEDPALEKRIDDIIYH